MSWHHIGMDPALCYSQSTGRLRWATQNKPTDIIEEETFDTQCLVASFSHRSQEMPRAVHCVRSPQVITVISCVLYCLLFVTLGVIESSTLASFSSASVGFHKTKVVRSMAEGRLFPIIGREQHWKMTTAIHESIY